MRAHHLVLLRVPARAEAEPEAALAEQLQAPDLLGENDRLPDRGDEDAGAEVHDLVLRKVEAVRVVVEALVQAPP